MSEPEKSPSQRKSRLGDIAPLGLMALSVCMAAFGVGVAVAEYKLFPYQQIHNAAKTLAAMRPGRPVYLGDILTDDPPRPGESPANRVRVLDPAAGSEPLLLYGGLNQYNELCPEMGCIAVQVDGRGGVQHAYPYRPALFHAANIAEGHKYEGDLNPIRNSHPSGLKRMPSGDLLAVFQRTVDAPLFPYGTGVAMLAPDGKPKWFRLDYSHHWPTVTQDGRLLITTSRLGSSSDPVGEGDGPGAASFSLVCQGTVPYRDGIRILDANGRVTREIPVLDAILASPFAPSVRLTSDPCDPTHLNYIDLLRPSAAGLIEGAAPGDFVVSLRTMSAFGIVDAKTGRLKRIFHGSFKEQHSVHHLDGSKFLIFDNQGDYARGGSSRLMEVDVATGAERTIFPTAASKPEHRRLYSETAGYLDISPDRSRAFVTFTESGRAVEVRLSDGTALREVANIHSAIAGASSGGRPSLYRLYGVDYVTH